MGKKITDKVELKRLWLELIDIHSTIRESVETPNKHLLKLFKDGGVTEEDYLNEKRYYHSGEEYGPDDKAIPVFVGDELSFINPLDIGTRYELVHVFEVESDGDEHKYSIFSVEKI